MKISIGTKYITHYSPNIPCDCNKACPIDHLWFAGWRVRLWKVLGIKFLIWSQDGLSGKDKIKE